MLRIKLVSFALLSSCVALGACSGAPDAEDSTGSTSEAVLSGPPGGDAGTTTDAGTPADSGARTTPITGAKITGFNRATSELTLVVGGTSVQAQYTGTTVRQLSTGFRGVPIDPCKGLAADWDVAVLLNDFGFRDNFAFPDLLNRMATRSCSVNGEIAITGTSVTLASIQPIP